MTSPDPDGPSPEPSPGALAWVLSLPPLPFVFAWDLGRSAITRGLPILGPWAPPPRAERAGIWHEPRPSRAPPCGRSWHLSGVWRKRPAWQEAPRSPPPCPERARPAGRWLARCAGSGPPYVAVPGRPVPRCGRPVRRSAPS